MAEPQDLPTRAADRRAAQTLVLEDFLAYRIRRIADAVSLDFSRIYRDRFGLTTADQLGIREASNLIDELKSDEPTASPSTNGNGAHATTGGAR